MADPVESIQTVAADRVGWAAPVVVAVAASLLVLFATSRYGPGITPDSVQYLSAAQSFQAGDGLTGIDGTRVAWWAPGYPVLLSATSSLFDLSVVEASRFLNAVAILVSTLLAWHLLSALFPAPTALLVLIVYALGSCQLVVTTKMLTEPAFAVLINLLVGLLGRGDRWRSLLLAAVIGAACFLMRYAGAAIVAAAALYVILSDSSRRTGLWKAVVLSVVAAVPGILWMLRNLRVSGTLTGVRSNPESLDAVASTFVAGMSELFVLPGLPSVLSLVTGSAVVLLIGWSILHVYLTAVRGGGLKTPAPRMGVVELSAIVVAVYLAFLVFTSFTGLSSPINARLLHPVLLPTLIVIGAAATLGSGALQRALRPVLVALVVVTVGGGTLYAVMRHDLGGGGLNTEAWRNSATVLKLRDVPDISPFWSNKPEAIRFFRGVQSFSLVEDDLEEESAGVVVVWFADYGRNADAYRQWAARRFAWLLPTLVSAQRPVDAAVDCNAVRRDLSIERGVVVAAMGDGCIFAVGATDGE